MFFFFFNFQKFSLDFVGRIESLFPIERRASRADASARTSCWRSSCATDKRRCSSPSWSSRGALFATRSRSTSSACAADDTRTRWSFSAVRKSEIRDNEPAAAERKKGDEFAESNDKSGCDYIERRRWTQTKMSARPFRRWMSGSLEETMPTRHRIAEYSR